MAPLVELLTVCCLSFNLYHMYNLLIILPRVRSHVLAIIFCMLEAIKRTSRKRCVNKGNNRQPLRLANFCVLDENRKNSCTTYNY